MLESHFKESHPDLLNKTVHVPSPFLLPLWRPFSPLHHDPLPLPTHVPPGLTLIPPVKGSWRTQPRTPRRIEEAKIASPKRKKHGPQIPDVKADVKEDAEHEEIEFEDLPKQLDSGGSYAWEAERECVLQSVGPPVDVARPQPILDPNIFGYRIPRKSILYDAFVELHIAEWDMDDEEEPEDDSQLTVTEIRLHPNTGHGSQIPSSSRVASQADN
ncbi:hypothetical protein CPB84DRAFT_1130285 [Gymnopilus junonius]|uniref:Uncharacterized protein n=1 Tax=Gymnopilus junonius TaxID=109634 RepID=A0A9P5TNB6_GYMJU|nr:hypothetical protein CPB84DRAFT_1130285 [Gymnopilus junonius]